METGTFIFLAMGLVPMLLGMAALFASFYFKSWGLAGLALAVLIFPIFYFGFVGLIFLGH